MDFGSTAPAGRAIRNRTQALTLQVGGWGLGGGGWGVEAGVCGIEAGSRMEVETNLWREEGAVWGHLCGCGGGSESTSMSVSHVLPAVCLTALACGGAGVGG